MAFSQIISKMMIFFLLYICIDYLFHMRLMPCVIYAAYAYGAYTGYYTVKEHNFMLHIDHNIDYILNFINIDDNGVCFLVGP